MIGKLIYLTVTKPDRDYAICLLSYFMHEPKVAHWRGALCELSYIKGASGKDLLYRKHGHLNVEVFYDSSYAGNKANRKSAG